MIKQVEKKHNRHIDGRCLKQYYCIDCNKPISVSSGFYGNGKCLSCANKGNNNPSYKDGRSLKNNHCLGCGKKLYCKANRCKICRLVYDGIRRGVKYFIKENYFNNINTRNKAYFLGLLFADGSNNPNVYKVALALSGKENKSIVEK